MGNLTRLSPRRSPPLRLSPIPQATRPHPLPDAPTRSGPTRLWVFWSQPLRWQQAAQCH